MTKNKTINLFCISASLHRTSIYDTFFYIYGYDRHNALKYFKERITWLIPRTIRKCNESETSFIEKKAPSNINILNSVWGFEKKGIKVKYCKTCGQLFSILPNDNDEIDCADCRELQSVKTDEPVVQKEYMIMNKKNGVTTKIEGSNYYEACFNKKINYNNYIRVDIEPKNKSSERKKKK